MTENKPRETRFAAPGRRQQRSRSSLLRLLCAVSHLAIALSSAAFCLSSARAQAPSDAGVAWREADIGTPASGESGKSLTAGNRLTIRAVGVDMLHNPSPQIHFQYAPVQGDFQIIVHLDAKDQQDREESRAGIMLRENLTPTSPYIFCFSAQQHLRGLQQNADGQQTYAFTRTDHIPTPVWLKLARWHGTISASYSVDGKQWNIIHREKIYNLADSLLVGCAVSHGAKTGATTATFDKAALGPLQLPYKTSWIGNTGGGGEKWVQDHIAAMYVAPDGTCYTQAEWDEAGRWVGMYRDGDVVGAIYGSSPGKAITGDGQIIYVGGTVLGAKRPAVCRFHPDGAFAKIPGQGNNAYILLPPESVVTALAVGGGSLFVADAPHNRIRVCDSVTGAMQHDWACEAPRALAVDRSNNVWVSQQVNGNALIRCFTPAGEDTGRKIGGLVDPGAIAIDAQGRLLVAENGPDLQIRTYDNLGGTPRLIRTFGTRGGIYSGVPGVVGEQKLPANIVGLGTDRAGNLYIGSDGWNWSGVDIRKYTPAGTMAWQVLGLQGVIDFGDIDAHTMTDAYAAQEHYTLDFSRPQGREWKYTGYTLDKFAYPDDPRLHIADETTMVRYLKDNAGRPRRFLFQTNAWGSYLTAYRFDAQHGEVAIPCRMWSNGRAKTQQETTWPPQQPKSGNWQWIDRNGDGAFQAEEFAALPAEGTGWDIDPNGDLWQGGKSLHYFKSQGVDAHGVPQFAEPQTIPAPAPFTEIHRIKYLPQTDTLYLSGFTTDHPNTPYDGFNEVGTEMARYDHWRQGGHAPAWRTVLARNAAKTAVTMGMDVAGDYAFTVENFSARVHIYDAATGIERTALTPGPEVGGESGWVDIPYGIHAFRRANGEYLILLEEDYKNKMLMYRWTPQNAHSAKPSGITGARRQRSAGNTARSAGYRASALGLAKGRSASQ